MLFKFQLKYADFSVFFRINVDTQTMEASHFFQAEGIENLSTHIRTRFRCALVSTARRFGGRR